MALSNIERTILAAVRDIVGGEARLVLALGAFDAANAAAAYGYDSTAKWLAWRAEMAPGTAREYVRVARALRGLPQTAAALEAGRIGFSRVRAITRIATPRDEEQWLELARSRSAAELEDIVRDRRDAAIIADPTLQAAQRSLRTKRTKAGMLALDARFTAIDGATLERALLAASRALPASDETDEDLNGSPLADRRRADALLTIARAYLAGHTQTKRDEYAVLIHLDGITGQARLHEGPALPPETLAPILGCARVSLTGVAGHTQPAPKTLTRALRRAILHQRPRCQYPGCRNNVWLHIHHKIHRAHGGGNQRSNLVPLCTQHHRAIHELGLTLEHDTQGRIQARKPDGRLITAVPPPLEEGEPMAS